VNNHGLINKNKKKIDEREREVYFRELEAELSFFDEFFEKPRQQILFTCHSRASVPDSEQEVLHNEFYLLQKSSMRISSKGVINMVQ
jgi:hypothetical protein